MRLLEGQISSNLNRSKFLLITLFTTSLLLFSEVSVAQEDDCMLDPNIECPPEPIPLDGGVIILIAAGAVYGYKKINDNSNNPKI